MTEKPTPKPKKHLPPSEQRRERLEQALRENLKKRKELARKRSSGADKVAESGEVSEAAPVTKD